MGVNHHYVRINVRGFQTEEGQYQPHLISGTLGDIEDCPEKCDRCSDLKKVKKTMKRSVFECHRLYEILQQRNHGREEVISLEEAIHNHHESLAQLSSERAKQIRESWGNNVLH